MHRYKSSDEEWSIIEPLLPRNSGDAERVDDWLVIKGFL
tara:strand:+ start:419 stop:535 length:117 start_codon:yes stop_codon:yes gene_type:complete